MSEGTYDLLVAERNAELEYRDNLYPIKFREQFEMPDGSKVSLKSSNHMLGASQVQLELSCGYRLGYSGDFGWPLDEVIQVEELVIDSTYGSPKSIRRYSQESVEERLQEIVCEKIRCGPVHIKAHRGTIERVLQILGSEVGVPILASDRLVKSVQVYQNNGFAVGQLTPLDSHLSRAAQSERSYVRLYAKGDGWGNSPPSHGTTICCSAYMVPKDNPILEFSDRAYRVALTNHADFNETIEYIRATGAKVVVTDNTRSHGYELAIAIKNRIKGVRAEPSTNNEPPRWSY